MRRKSTLLVFLVVLGSLPWLTLAGEPPLPSRGGDVVHGGNLLMAKAGADTINLMAASDDPTNNINPLDGGFEPYYDGDFEDALGNPAWNGWTHYDITQTDRNHWNVSNYLQADPANHAVWCGDINLPACDPEDPAGGYGNGWTDLIEFRRTVPNPASGSTVTVTAILQHDSEPGYDFTYLSCQYLGQPLNDLQSWDGTGTVAVDHSVGYLPTEYVEGIDIALFFRFQSDYGWSDEDCAYPSSGACRIDNINVHLVNGEFTGDFFEDFEHGGDPENLGLWSKVPPQGVGDFAKIWVGLEDLDPCTTNYSPQVAFIDDGVVVPGTGGSHCINWCYGPGGYIATTTGGLIGPSGHLHNAIESPAMAWPSSKGLQGGADYDGISFTFTGYRHEDLSWDSPGNFVTWAVRSADTDGSAGQIQVLAEQPWLDRNIVYYAGPEYYRTENDVTDLMNPGRDEVQVQLAVYQLGWVWDYGGNDGYPAPYFDNVTVKVFPYLGPGIFAREMDLAQDGFPEVGVVDLEDPGSLSVRFDMASNISPASHLRNDPGDSMVVDVGTVRSGAALDGNPRLHYVVRQNPAFDPYRTSGLPSAGSVAGSPAMGSTDWPDPNKWAFDLPDTGFLFPGDVLHYYISATDAIGGVGGMDPQTALLPADTTGFSAGFDYPQDYPLAFTVRALPSVDEGLYRQLKVLFIDDAADREGEAKWFAALSRYGLMVGHHYDLYYVNAPSSGGGNGIGGRATAQTLAGYSDLLYTSGDLGRFTLANGDGQLDPGNDVGVLADWLDQGRKDLFLTGDNLASDLAQAGDAALDFLEDYMGATLVTSDIRPLISNQTTPLVSALPGNPVFGPTLDYWLAYGGCMGINTFDGVETVGGGLQLAEFLSPGGYSGYYPYSAATLNEVGTSRVVSMPVDLGFVYPQPGAGSGSLVGSNALLWDLLFFFGVPGPPGDTLPGLPGITFQASNHPNPFNPSTTIKYSLPRAGHLKLSIYNVRGQLVKTLIDGVRPAGADQSIVWDGTDNLGSAAASGVYFYEARAAGEAKIGKMTLIK